MAFSATAMRTLEIREPWTECHDPGTNDEEGDGDGLEQRALTHIVEQAAAQADGEVRERANVGRTSIISVYGISPPGIGGIRVGHAFGRRSSASPANGPYRAIGIVFIPGWTL